MARTFDYSAFRAAFVQSAVARGIDPLAGATSYQVANLKADLRKREMLAARDYGWATANGRNIFSDADAQPTQIVVVEREARSAPDWLLPTAPSELQKHQEAWGTAVPTEKVRTRAVWTIGAGLPLRQLIAD